MLLVFNPSNDMRTPVVTAIDDALIVLGALAYKGKVVLSVKEESLPLTLFGQLFCS